MRRLRLFEFLVVSAFMALIWPRYIAEILFTAKHDAVATTMAAGKRRSLE